MKMQNFPKMLPQPIQTEPRTKQEQAKIDKNIIPKKNPDKTKDAFIVLSVHLMTLNSGERAPAAWSFVYEDGAGTIHHKTRDLSTAWGETFQQKSLEIMQRALQDVAFISKTYAKPIVYLDGFNVQENLLLVKVLLECNYKIKPIIRDHIVYDIEVGNFSEKNRFKREFRLRSYKAIFTATLSQLYRDFVDPKCTQSFDFEPLTETEWANKPLRLNICQKRALAFYEVLSKAQQILYERFHTDICKSLSFASLALKIYQINFHEPIITVLPSHESFIRQAYLGGRTDTFKPYATDVFVYDVNSLYPACMLQPMPYGFPKWDFRCKHKPLETLFGFIEAYIECPKSVTTPLLGVRSPNNPLLFATGRWRGVYFSEELKLAKQLGYKITPIKALIFEKETSPFVSFINTLYEARKSAKKEGQRAFQFLYKQLLVALYGRLGIREFCEITKIVNTIELQQIVKNWTISSVYIVKQGVFCVTYNEKPQKLKNAAEKKEEATDAFFKQNEKTRAKHSYSYRAVHISAAITSYARIHMYPFLSDALYTDTDSVITTKPLDESKVSSDELGFMKLEHTAKEYISLGPKMYALRFDDGTHKLVFRGLAKRFVTFDWFYKQYKQNKPESKQKASSVLLTFANWSKLVVTQKRVNINLEKPHFNKRSKVFDENGTWVDTLPFHIKQKRKSYGK